MTHDNKTSSFLTAINKYAQEQSEAIRKEAEEFRKQEIEKATKEAITKAYMLIQKNISIEKSKIVSEYARKEQESKKELFLKRNEIVDSVFSKATEKLIGFTNTEDYIEYIKKSANEIKNAFGDNKCTIFIKETDADKQQYITAIIENCNVEFDKNIKIGGIKGFCEELSIIADDTLDSKLESQLQWFYENSDLKVV